MQMNLSSHRVIWFRQQPIHVQATSLGLGIAWVGGLIAIAVAALMGMFSWLALGGVAALVALSYSYDKQLNDRYLSDVYAEDDIRDEPYGYYNEDEDDENQS